MGPLKVISPNVQYSEDYILTNCKYTITDVRKEGDELQVRN